MHAGIDVQHVSAAAVAEFFAVQSVHMVQRLVVRPKQLRRAAELRAASVYDELLRFQLWPAVLPGAAYDASRAGLSSSAGADECDPIVAAGTDPWWDADDSAAADDNAGHANDHYTRGCAAEPRAATGNVYRSAYWRHVYTVAEHDDSFSAGAWIQHAGTGRKFPAGTVAGQLWDGNELCAGQRSLHDVDAGGAAERQRYDKQKPNPSSFWAGAKTRHGFGHGRDSRAGFIAGSRTGSADGAGLGFCGDSATD
jgi:hypothetical protein